MAKHKSATEVTVASMTETGAFQQFVQKYWVPALAVVAAISALILFRQHQKDSAVADRMAQWSAFASQVTTEPTDGFLAGDPAELASLAATEGSGLAAGYLRAVEALNRRRDGDWEGTQKAASAIGPELALFHQPIDGGPSLASRIEASASEASAWEASHADLFANPPLPSDAPRVRLQTSAGDLVVGLYAERAPNHCENFLKLCKEGYYDGTRFHRIGAGFMIQGGDPNSREGAPETWGQGGPDDKIDPEQNKLLHFEGVLAAAKAPGATQSSGSQFYITVADRHELDGEYVVFGALVEGLEVAKEISDAPVVEGEERPIEPIEILSTEVL